MRVLLLVDLQNDFLPGGALAVRHGHETVPVANLLMPRFDHVVATQDWHPADHLSFASQHEDMLPGDLIDLGGLPQILWPDHCVQGSRGADFAPNLQREGIHAIFQKGQDRTIDSYSGFFDNGRRRATGLEAHLRALAPREVWIAGLATDYCVLWTALDAKELGFDVVVVEDGSRGVERNPGDSARALDEMRAAGIRVAQSSEA